MSSSKYESAKLILELYELRREETMRKARDWFFGFNPESADDIRAAAMGEHSAYYRMVTSYWDMAASMVNHGAIDEQMFNDANGEHAVVFAKIQPYVENIRTAMNAPQYMQHLEKLVMRMPDAETKLVEVRERIKMIAKAMSDARAAGQQ